MARLNVNDRNPFADYSEACILDVFEFIRRRRHSPIAQAMPAGLAVSLLYPGLLRQAWGLNRRGDFWNRPDAPLCPSVFAVALSLFRVSEM